MLIALDYDGTYTRDPKLWNGFVSSVKSAGHEVVCFTMRTPFETINMPCLVIYTSRKAKAKYAVDAGFQVDIWIDNDPLFLIEDAA